MPIMLAAGELTNALTVELPVAPGRATGGDVGDTFAPSGGLWWVKLEGAGGREHKQATTSIGQATHTITGPFRSDVSIRARLTCTDVLLARARVFNIVEVDDLENRHVTLRVRAQEVLA
jgi:head-tail adaptor